MFEFDGATVTATRPHGFEGRPVEVEMSFHVAPPSVDLNNALALGAVGPLPPERNVQPWRRKSHIPAYSVFGFCRSSDSIEQPVDGFSAGSTFFHDLPPSVVL